MLQLITDSFSIASLIFFLRKSALAVNVTGLLDIEQPCNVLGINPVFSTGKGQNV